MYDEHLFPEPEDNSAELKAQEEFDELVFLVFSTDRGKDLLAKFNEMLLEPKWFPNEEASIGYYREGGNQMLRHLIGCYKSYENK